LTLKATVPVAPVVSAALIVTLVPKELEVGFALRVVLEVTPGTTGIRGDERRLYSE
jgi:hypothetical protein